MLRRNKIKLKICLVKPLQSCYSPVSSIISVSTNRSVNIKESKEKRNREKLMAGPGSNSEFSLAPEDMEMDYYDYNVINAANAPGSYLGMDPAFLVWIPPLDDGTPHTEEDENSESDATHSDEEPHYDEISPTYEDMEIRRIDEAPELPPLNKKSVSPDTNDYFVESNKNVHLNKVLIANTFNAIEDEVDTPKVQRRKMSGNLLTRKQPIVDSIPMTVFRSKNKSNGNHRNVESPVKVHRTQSYQNQEQRCSYASDDKDIGTEKETAVVKSPSDNFKDYYELDDIQFADDDSEDECNVFNSNQNGFVAKTAMAKIRDGKNSRNTLFEMH